MRTVGLIGGMSWESSAHYYRLINRTVQDRLGGVHSAPILLWSVDFAPVAEAQAASDWDRLAGVMEDAARRLHAGGAEVLLICTNTMHRLADVVTAAVPLPLIHIADPTADAIRTAGHRRIGLLGTAFTMEQPFYRDRLADRFGLEVLVPPADDRATVHRIIYNELVRGRIEPASRDALRGVIARLAAAGAEAVILGCTEIMLLIGQPDSPVPLFDTTLHAADAALA